MTGYDRLIYEVNDGIASITLNRPDALNALDADLVTQLADAALRCVRTSGIRAVLLRGAGTAFCAGGDLKSFVSAGEALSGYVHETATQLHTAISRFARMDPPVIAAVRGAAAGAGMSLVCACDLVIAAESARFTLAYTRIGLTPNGSSSYFLPRLVGHRRALELTLTNRTLTAQEAMEWGIVTRVVADADLMAAAESLARDLAAGPTRAFGASKRLLLLGWTESLETQMTHETSAIAAAAAAPEGQEGMRAFVEKRAPRFKAAE